MNTYRKIQTVFKRDPETKYRTLLMGEYSLPEFEYLKDAEWVFTEKVDGMNMRIRWVDEKCTFAGKSDNAQIPGRLNERMVALCEQLAPQFSEKFGVQSVCLYGEGYGAGIQKGGYYQESQEFILFDVKMGNVEQGVWASRLEVEETARECKLGIVPVFGEGTLDDLVELCQIGNANLLSEVANEDHPAEGIVARPRTELRTRYGDRVITKLKVKDFPR